MSARIPGPHGHTVEDGWLSDMSRRELRDLADQFPAGARIRHACGREGTVALDQVAHIPGAHLGAPSSVCLRAEDGEPMVFAHWDNDQGFNWGVWVPVAQVRHGSAPALNRPGNTAWIGGRR
ncbi:hypothetical protein ACF1AX_31440 [Streptomyces sp. NPDC014802]|uniref:hypothetical protein n=1 Tax=Streptomyces sp. NPDC014802 TaxID=3364917 RepID=UPI0036F88F1A